MTLPVNPSKVEDEEDDELDDDFDEDEETESEESDQQVHAEERAFLRFAELTREERRLKEQLDLVLEEKHNLEPALRDVLLISPHSTHKHLGFTIFLRSQLWAKAQEGQTQADCCRELKAAGLAHFVEERVAVQKLSAHVRELRRVHQQELTAGDMELKDLLPSRVAAVINVAPSYSVIAQSKESID